MIKKEESHRNLIIWGLGAVLLAVVFLSFFLGRYSLSPAEVLGILLSRVLPIQPFWTDTMASVFFYIRLPRILMACLVGCCLSAAGASYQGIFRNPLAAPDILGASAGAAFGAALAILLYGSSRWIAISAFAFSLLTVMFVYLISSKARGSKILALVLSGIMISSLFSAGTSFIKLVADPTDQLPAITYWLMGSLSGVKLDDVLFAFLPMLAGLIPLLLLRWRINVMTLGDDEARTIGVNPKLIRSIIIVCATLVTATSVAFSGMIGFVGLVVPHLTRRLIGNNYRYLMPASMLFGALFLLLVDDISRNLLSTEIPLGILTAAIGAPFFIYLIFKEAA